MKRSAKESATKLARITKRTRSERGAPWAKEGMKSFVDTAGNFSHEAEGGDESEAEEDAKDILAE